MKYNSLVPPFTLSIHLTIFVGGCGWWLCVWGLYRCLVIFTLTNQMKIQKTHTHREREGEREESIYDEIPNKTVR